MSGNSRSGNHSWPLILAAFILVVASFGCAIAGNPTATPKVPETVSQSSSPVQTHGLSGAPEWTPAFFHPTSDATPTRGMDAAANLLRNPGFEEGFSLWNRDPDPPGATTEIDSTLAHTGSRSLRITFDGSADLDFWQVGQSVPVEPNTTYRLQGYLRVSGIQAYQSVCLVVTDGRGWEYQGYSTADLYTTQDWTLVSTIAFTTLPDARSAKVYIGRGNMGGKFPIRGTAWVDDIVLVRLPAYLSPSTATLRVGDSQAATISNAAGPYIWKSSNPTVAAVQSDDQGTGALVTALSPGDAEITAVDAEGKIAQTAIHVLAQSAITVHAGRVLREVPDAMFGSNVNHFDAEVDGRPDWGEVIHDPAFLAEVAELGLTSLRYPGGTFANYYDFSVGKGYVPWREESGQYNLVGITTDQFLQFLRDTGIPNAMITANIYKSGNKYWPGNNWISPQVAADWVDYINHESGFRVEYWELGNEVEYSDSFPWEADPQVPGLTREMYLQKIGEWSRAMKAVDPAIKIGAVAVLPGRGGGKPEWWDLPLIQERSADIDFLIVHPYVRVNPYMAEGTYTDSTATDTYAWIWATHPVETLHRWLERYAPGRSNDIEIQASEWAVIAFPELPETHTDTLLNAVLSTDMLWDMVREGVDGANLYSLCSWGFYTMEPVSGGRTFAQYQMLWMNRNRSGRWLLDTRVDAPTYTSGPLGGDVSEQKVYGTMDGVPYLSAYATLSGDRKQLYLIVTNKSGEPQTAILELDGFTPRNQASIWQMTSGRWDDTGIQPGIFTFPDADSRFTYSFPARSVTSFVFNLR